MLYIIDIDRHRHHRHREGIIMDYQAGLKLMAVLQQSAIIIGTYHDTQLSIYSLELFKLFTNGIFLMCDFKIKKVNKCF